MPGGMIISRSTGVSINVTDPDLRFRFRSPMQRIAALTEKTSAAAEEMRLLYVALTRAREELHAVCAVKKPENVRLLRQNGVVLFLDRPLDALTVGGGRPLSSSVDALRTMYAERRPLYLAAADAVVPNETTVADAVKASMEALDEIFDH